MPSVAPGAGAEALAGWVQIEGARKDLGRFDRLTGPPAPTPTPAPGGSR